MRKYALAYSAWLVGVLAMGAAAVEWYKHVESIEYREVWERLKNADDGARTDTE